jgi:hypothetical protein
LAVLGVNIGANTGSVPFRMAIYTNSSNAPLNLVAQTVELSSVDRTAVEGTVSGMVTGPADYWICMESAATLQIATETTLTTPACTGPRTYGVFPAVEPALMLFNPTPVAADVYAVTTP